MAAAGHGSVLASPSVAQKSVRGLLDGAKGMFGASSISVVGAGPRG